MDTTIKQRGGWRPGAGRKKGVPNKLTAGIKALASQYGPDALETLVRIMNEGESEQARIAAAKELLDRGFGRPAQALELYRGREVTVIVDRSRANSTPKLIGSHSGTAVEARD